MKIIKKIAASSEPYFSQYTRLVEREWDLRLNRRGYRWVFPGDLMIFFKRGGKGEFVVLQVLERKEFPSFKKALEYVGHEAVIPGSKSVEEAVEKLREFYSVEEELEHGVVAFKVEPIAVYRGEITPELLAKYLRNFR